VEAVLGQAEFAKVGQPRVDIDARAPDLWLAAKSGYSFSDSVAGEDVVAPRSTPGGTHGYLPEHADMLGTLVIWGYGVQPGGQVARARNLDVAPTMAHLLGVALPTADGEVLKPLLKRP